MPYCVGLTGGIGCGKSTVAQMFEALGATIIDTDSISHDLTQPNAPGLQQIAQQFGPEFVSSEGVLDRAKLRALIFSNRAQKTKLESILHPLIEAQVRNELLHCQGSYALIVVPLLFETGHYLPLLQRKLVVDCDELSQITRTAARSHLPEAEIRTIMEHQLSRQDRLTLADDILCNEADLGSLHAAIAVLHHQYLALASSAAKP